MKIIPEQSTSFIDHTSPHIRVDTGACCFFVLGMFLSAMLLNLMGIFPSL